MTTALRFALRDMRGALAGLRLLVACMLVGVAAIAGVGSLSAAILDGMAREGQRILGGDIELRLTQRAATPLEFGAMRRVGATSAVVRLRAMVQGAPGRDPQLGELKAVDGAYPLYGAVRLRPGGAVQALLARAADGRPGALLSPLLAERIGVAPGQTVRIGQGLFRVAGLLDAEPDAAGDTFGFGPPVMIAAAALPETGLVQPGSLVRYHYRIRLLPSQDPQTAIASLDRQFPQAGWQARDRTQGAQGTRRFIDQLGEYLTLVGLSALLVAGIGVANAVQAWLDRKNATIAVCKVLGATSGFIVRVFGFQLALVTLAAILAGLAVGALVPAAAGRLLADQLPVVPRLALYPAPLLLAAGFGIAVAVAAATLPLARARQVPAAALLRGAVDAQMRRPPLAYRLASVCAAGSALALAVFNADQRMLALGIAAGGVATLALLFGIGWLVTAGARRLPRPRAMLLRLAIANLHRPGALTRPVVTALGLGLTLFATLAVVEANLRNQLAHAVPDKAPAFFFLDIAKDDIGRFRDVVAAVPGVGAVEAVPSLRGPVIAVKGVPAAAVRPHEDAAWVLRGDRGLTYARDIPAGNAIVRGDWWPPDYAGPPIVSVDEEIARGLNLELGDAITVSVLGVDLTARVANLRRVDWDSLGLNFVLVFPPATLAAAPHGWLATVEARGPAAGAVYRAATRAFPAVSIVRTGDTLAMLASLMAQVATAVRSAGAVTLLAGLLVLMGALAAGRQARSRDFALLRLLGATRGQIVAVFAIEFLLLGLVTAGIAAGLGSVAGWYLVTRVLDLHFIYQGGAVVLAVLGGLLLILLVGIAGTWPVLSARPARVLTAP